MTHTIGRLGPRLLDVGLPLALGLLTAGLIIRRQPGSAISDPVAVAAFFGPPLLICLSFLARPLRFSFGVGAFLLATALTNAGQGTVILTDRSFFGIHRVKHVTLGDTQSFHVLMHGNTIHGLQSLDVLRGTEPLGYYHRTGPFGQVVSAIGIRGRPVAIVGLGTGALVCYGTSGQRWDFFEIDPAVERIARDSRFFTYLRDCPADARVTIGDGRLALARQREAGPAYQLLVLDAYSASSIPVHLLTREAVQVYLDRLAAAGVLAFHISTRHLELAPILGALADDAGLVCLIRSDPSVSADEAVQGKTPSRWAVMARRRTDLGALADDPRWQQASAGRGVPVWTDDFSSVVGIVSWR